MTYLEEVWKRLPSDWDPVLDGERLLEELKRETVKGHPLSGLKFIVFARANYEDDIAVMLEDGQVAEVHLTWTKGHSPDWPPVSGPMSLDQWLEQRAADRKWREGAIDGTA